MERAISSDNINWNNIIKKEVRGINDIYLGTVRGISEPFILTEKGTIIKEKFFIPKNLLERYDDIVVYCGIDEKEARNYFMRNLQSLYKYYYSNSKIIDLNEESKSRYNINEEKARNNTSIYDKTELTKNIKGILNELTEIIQSIVRTAEQKIKETQIVIKKVEAINLEAVVKEMSNKIKRLLYSGVKVSAANLSKMLQFAMQFTNSFEDVLSKIRRRIYL